jgi:hypothetical protein
MRIIKHPLFKCIGLDEYDNSYIDGETNMFSKYCGVKTTEILPKLIDFLKNII